VASTAHRVPERPPLRLDVGDVVEAGARDTEWPAFVFVTTPTGSGWVPARYLSAPRGPAAMVEAYDTTELATRAGEVLDVLACDLEGGWLWCRSSRGDEGWVPVRTLGELRP
jgi:hypothetical protein